MKIAEEKKHEYWNHFIAVGFVGTAEGYGRPKALTPTRLRVLQVKIWNDAVFWNDIILRHGGEWRTPEQMREQHISVYQHCRGNFWGMLMQTAVEMGLVK